MAGELRDIFGAENVFVELMDHGLEIERRVQKDLLRLARDLGLPLVATNDLHYTRAEDAKSHAALLCVQSGSTLMDPNRFKFDAEDFYLKSAAGDAPPLARAARGVRQHPAHRGAVRGLVRRRARAATCRDSRCPEGEDETSWFIKEVESGLQRRFPDGVPDYARKQAAFEEDVIVSKGYAGYFLVVADFINWAKRNGIRVGPGRGSGAGLHVRLRDGHHRPRPDPARPDLRAVPQPRAHVDARLRRRLRRAPTRRGHQVRHREVRRGARRADRHLRHHQGQAGRQGRGTRDGPPVQRRASS